MRVPRLHELLIVTASAATFVIAGHFAASALIDAQQAAQLRELGDTSLRRAETAVKYGAETLDSVLKHGTVSCEPSAMQAVRLHIYQHGTVKDIRVLDRDDAAIRCSAYPDTLEFDTTWASRDEMLPAHDTGLRLFRVEQFSGVALGVLRDVSADTSLASIVAIDPSIFDIMPGELRSQSAVALELTNGREVAHHATGDPIDAAVVTVETPSTLYPMRTRITVASAALATWHSEPYWPMVLAAALLGLAFGVLLARMSKHVPDAVAELDDAIAAGQIKPYLQPLFDLASGRIVGCEALARWIRADGTVVPPARFIPIAEASGRIEAVTWQIIEATLDALRSTLKNDPGFKVSVNIVPDHILSRGFAEKLHRTVLAANVSPTQVVLEITERQQVDDLARAAGVIADLRLLGFRVALDDVGVGHSGLSHIQALGASIIKIDKFFVDVICRDPTATAIVEMLVRLASELRMRVVAEGIEDRAQSRALAACGVHEGQGYLVSPPLPVDKFLAFLQRPNETSATETLQAA